MKYALDTEFIDVPECSALISLGLVSETGRSLYFEFDFPREHLTPWLNENVIPHLSGKTTTNAKAVAEIIEYMRTDRRPEVWCYFGAYDWYHFSRLFGGMLLMPDHWPHRYREFADKSVIPEQCVEKPAHHALKDARSLMNAIHVVKPKPW